MKSETKNNKKIGNIIVIIIGILVVIFCIKNVVSDTGNMTKLIDEATGIEQKEKRKAEVNNLLEEIDKSTKDDDSITSKYQKLYTFDKYKNMCKTISYKDLSRNPDNYLKEHIYFKGKVIQVMEDMKNGIVELRVNTKMSDYTYSENDYDDDTIYIGIDKYDKNNRILEDDIIEIWGLYAGIVTYETVLGSETSIPGIVGVYWKVE